MVWCIPGPEHWDNAHAVVVFAANVPPWWDKADVSAVFVFFLYQKASPLPLVVPHPLSFPGGGGVTWSTQNFSLRLLVLLCG